MRTPIAVLQRVHGKVERGVHGALHNRPGLDTLVACADPRAAAIARAIEATLDPPVDTVTEAWCERIETLRGQLEADRSLVQGLDFGAGSPRAPRSAEDMARGVPWEKPLCEVVRWSKGPAWGRLYYELVRALRPGRCLELGTCLGVSAAYQAAGLCANGAGALVTLEGAPALAAKSRLHFERLGLRNVEVLAGPFHESLPRVLGAAARFDWVAIDGHHDGPATLAYFEQILPHATDGSVFVFDDIRWSVGMNRAWDALCADDRVRTIVDLFQVGVCVAGSASLPKSRHKLAIE